MFLTDVRLIVAETLSIIAPTICVFLVLVCSMVHCVVPSVLSSYAIILLRQSEPVASAQLYIWLLVRYVSSAGCLLWICSPRLYHLLVITLTFSKNEVTITRGEGNSN